MNLKDFRTKLQLSQTEVAKRVGVSLTSYQNWEREVTTPTKENYDKLCEVLEIEREV